MRIRNEAWRSSLTTCFQYGPGSLSQSKKIGEGNPSGLQKYMFITSVSMGQECRLNVCKVSLKAALVGLCSFPDPRVLSCPHSCWENSVPCSCRVVVPVLLLVVNWVSSWHDAQVFAVDPSVGSLTLRLSLPPRWAQSFSGSPV